MKADQKHNSEDSEQDILDNIDILVGLFMKQEELKGKQAGLWDEFFNKEPLDKWVDWVVELDQALVGLEDQKDKQLEVIYSKPRWRRIMYDATNTECGRLLLGYVLIKKEEARLVEHEDIYPSCQKQKIHMLTIGLRNIISDTGSFKPFMLDVDFNISKFRENEEKAY